MQKQQLETDWISQAACKGMTDIFFAPISERPQATAKREAKAKQICLKCPVFNECRNYARTNGEYGYWAGENEYDRALLGYKPSTGQLRTTTLRQYKKLKEISNGSVE